VVPVAGWEAIPGHRLTCRLGAGAFGEVWEAVDRDGRAVALKFVDCRSKPRSILASEVRVLRALSGLRHPNIIGLRGVLGVGHYIVLSMERADGNLHDLRRTYVEMTGKNIPVDHALELVEQAAAALDFLAGLKMPEVTFASRGLQHCDIKPNNLLLLGETLKVADFGLCQGTTGQGARGWRGTPPYAAPELYYGQAAPGTDQYALAVTFCELTRGEQLLRQPPPPGAPPDGLPPVSLGWLREREVLVITRALHPQPSARWPSCQAFVKALRAAYQGPRSRGVRRHSSGTLRPVRV
jgi:serine/threonine protein kinase